MRYRRYGNSCCLGTNEKIKFGHTSKICCSVKEIEACLLQKKLFQQVPPKPKNWRELIVVRDALEIYLKL